MITSFKTTDHVEQTIKDYMFVRKITNRSQAVRELILRSDAQAAVETANESIDNQLQQLQRQVMIIGTIIETLMKNSLKPDMIAVVETAVKAKLERYDANDRPTQ